MPWPKNSVRTDTKNRATCSRGFLFLRRRLLKRVSRGVIIEDAFRHVVDLPVPVGTVELRRLRFGHDPPQYASLGDHIDPWIVRTFDHLHAGPVRDRFALRNGRDGGV